MTTGTGQQQGDPLHAWVDLVAELWPPRDAEGWDQVGLHVGDPARDVVTGVLVSLDVTPAVLDEARERDADLVLAHHPLLFGPLRRLTPDTASGATALQAARQGCAVLAAHTNVDKAADGTSHPAARALGLLGLRPLEPMPAPAPPSQVKLVTFTPHAATDGVLQAMAAAGAGRIGDYTECAFTTPGTGTFRPGADSDPHLGTPGAREQVAEDRLEVILPAAALPDVVAALRRAHPYEEVPVDVYPTLPAPPVDPPAARGLGLVGTLPEPTPLRDVARTLAGGLAFPSLRLAADDPDRRVTTVAVCGGSGDSLIGAAIAAGAEVFVTSDLKHHPTLDALTMGLALVDAGHFATEDPAMDVVARTLTEAARTAGLNAPVHRSTTSTDPWTTWRATT